MLCTPTMRTHGASYSKCINPKACMAVHHTKGITMTLMAFSYTCCTELYISMTYIVLRVPHAVYTNYQVPLHPVQQVYDSENAHGITTPLSEHSHANGIVAHPLYGSVQLPDVHHLTLTTDCLHQLWRPVVPPRYSKCTIPEVIISQTKQSHYQCKICD